MAKMNRFKRLCADTNVLIGLALLYYRGERVFIDTNIAGRNSRSALKQYAEELKNLQGYIEREHIQIVIPPQVMFELKYREKNIDKNGNMIELSPETIARQKLKDLTLEYLEEFPQVKVARILPLRKAIFEQFTARLADEYVNTYRIFERNAIGGTPSDATIMAETSALGIDFLSRDQHFHKMHYLAKCSRADKIALANKSLGGRPTKVVDIAELDGIMQRRSDKGLVAKRSFSNNKPIADCAYMSYKEYLEDRTLERKNHMAWLQKHTTPTQDM